MLSVKFVLSSKKKTVYQLFIYCFCRVTIIIPTSHKKRL